MSVQIPTSARFHHLDALRGGLMFWGVLVHAGTLGKDPVIDWIGKISGLVRMEAFFVISGFLGAMLLAKRGARETIIRRTFAIGVPLAVSLLLLNPPTIALMTYFHNGTWPWAIAENAISGAALRGPMNWHLHLWFLFCLLIYVLLSPSLKSVIGLISSGVQHKIARMRPSVILVLVSMMAASTCLVTRMTFELVLEPLLPGWSHFITKSAGYYLAFYFIGMLAYHLDGIRRALEKPQLLLAALSGAAFVGSHLIRGRIPNQVCEALILASGAFLAVALTGLLIALALKFASSESRFARFLSDAAYTVYLFHFLVLYVVAVALSFVIEDRLAIEILSAIATLIIASAIHLYVVSRSKWLLVLFNGRIDRLHRLRGPVTQRTASAAHAES